MLTSAQKGVWGLVTRGVTREVGASKGGLLQFGGEQILWGESRPAAEALWATCPRLSASVSQPRARQQRPGARPQGKLIFGRDEEREPGKRVYGGDVLLRGGP